MEARDRAIDLYMTGIRDGRPHEALDRNIGARYTQHSTGVADGKDGFLEFFLPFLERNPIRDIQVVRSLQDGRHVFIQAYQNLGNGDAEWVTMDFFDSDDEGKIIEHWDVIAAYSSSNPSGRSSVDGPTEITDLDQTDANKAVVRELIEQVLMGGGDPMRIGEFIADDYLQHNPEVGDGLETFAKLAQDPNAPLHYDEIFLMVGEGNFVATLSKANWEGAPLCQADLFRLENGKVVEHWDASEPVTDDTANSGKF